MEGAPKKLSHEDREAALELAREDTTLMRDPFTADVIQRGGKTADGRDIEDIGHFLADRKEWLAKNPDVLAAGPRSAEDIHSDRAVHHSKSWETKESHE